MKNHVIRPFLVVFAVLVVLLTVRLFFVPKDFKVGDRGFMYSYHRAGSEKDWANVKVKYQSREYCADCHDENYKKIMASPHKIIQCENCHGPAVDHPDTIEKLPIDKSRELCERCHTKLEYPTSLRGKIKGIDPQKHFPGKQCSVCHNPHHPNLNEKRVVVNGK